MLCASHTKVLILLAILSLVYGQPFMHVFVAYDLNVNPSAIDAGMEIFRSQIKFTTATLLDITNDTAIAEAMINMQALYLCPGNTSFIIKPSGILSIQIFVQNGGILLFSSSEGDIRSQEVASWLSDPKIETVSISSNFTVDNYYAIKSQVRNFAYYLNFNYGQYRGKPTNQSLYTSFSRGSIKHGGLPWQWFSPDMYWISGYNRAMILTPANEEFCMFKREGPYGFYASNLEACFLFTFPHGSGYVVEMSTNFTDSGIFSQEFITTNIRIIETALQLNDYHESKFQNVILSYHDSFVQIFEPPSFSNVAYDLSTGANVFVWRNYNDIGELFRLLELTGANTLVVPNAQTGIINTKKNSYFYPEVLDFGLAYEFFVDNGGNIVSNVIVCVNFI